MLGGGGVLLLLRIGLIHRQQGDVLDQGQPQLGALDVGQRNRFVASVPSADIDDRLAVFRGGETRHRKVFLVAVFDQLLHHLLEPRPVQRSLQADVVARQRRSCDTGTQA